MRMRIWGLAMAAGAAATLAGCGGGSGASSSLPPGATVDTSAPVPAVTALAASLDSLPDDAAGREIRWGHAIVSHARDSLAAYTSTNLNCTSCHLDDGQRAGAAPFNGAYARYPRYIDRADETATIQDRMNYCITRSLAGRPLADDAPQMKAMVAYMKFLSRGALADTMAPGRGMPNMPKLTGDSTRGQAIFASTCVRCHGADGAGLVGPALWGPKSFSIGASMARESRGASFIRHNMPFDMPGTLTDQQAYDVAAYLATMPRPDFPNKAHDWPKGGAPYDVPYDTKGHAAFHHPEMLPRTAAAGGPSSP